jgi:hypothetical protein
MNVVVIGAGSGIDEVSQASSKPNIVICNHRNSLSGGDSRDSESERIRTTKKWQRHNFGEGVD